MMKYLNIFWLTLLALVLVSCSNDDDRLTGVISALPSNIDAKFILTQDNSGDVTIIPSAENANSFLVNFGDGSPASDTVSVGSRVNHTFGEGEYDVMIEAFNLAGESSDITKPLQISFNPPENVQVIVENDGIVSNTVNVTASGDFAAMFEVDFGEEGMDSVLIGEIDETVSYTYQSPGIYTITTVVKGASSETVTVIEEDFEVTEVLVPAVPAPTPTRPAPNVIAIFSDAYETITTTEFPTEWSDSGFEIIEVDGDNVIRYSNLAFTGIVTDYENPTDLTGMDFVHFDYWTTDATSLGFKIVNTAVDPPQEDIQNVGTPTQGEWVSIEIPLDDYTMDRSQVTQLLFDALGNRSTVFIDNLYFYTDAPTEPTVPAPTPTRAQEDVIAIYSDTFQTITTTEFPTSWSESVFEEIQIDGDNVAKYSNFAFTGIVSDYENPTDLSEMTHVHFDYWTPDVQELGLKLVNTALDPVQEDEASVGQVKLGEWVSVDIALDDFDFDRSQVTQFIIDNLIPENNSPTLFLDNFYFYK
jgi:hypothetical protein